MSEEFNYGPRPKKMVYVSEFEALEKRALAAEQERDKALALVASYDRLDELIGTEFEGVDEVTEVIRLLKEERDQLKAELQKAREAVEWKPIGIIDKSRMQFVLVTDCDLVRLQLWNPESKEWETGMQDPRLWKLTEIVEPSFWCEYPSLERIEKEKK